MRILLLQPPLIRTDKKVRLRSLDDGDNTRVSIGLYSLAALLKERGQTVKLFNHSLVPWKESLDEAIAFAPDLVGITCLTSQRMVAYAWTKSIKERLRGCKVLLGGPHATCLYEEILHHWPSVDFIAVGEAEESLCALVERLEKKESAHNIAGLATRNHDGSVHFPGPARLVSDLGALPVPSQYFHYDIITTSRGCPYDCSFCSSRLLWRSKVRYRPVPHIIEELEHLKRRKRSLMTFFKDETFTLRTGRVRELCQAMIDAGLDMDWFCDTRVDCVDEERLYWIRKAGCTQVSFGIESGSPAILDKIEKKTTPDQIRKATELARSFGLQVRYYLIAGYPGETPEDLMATEELVNECRPSCIVLNPLIMNPGTKVFRKYCEEHGKDNHLWFEPGQQNLLCDPEKRWLQTGAGQRLQSQSLMGNDEEAQKFIPPTEEELRTALAYPGLENNFNALYALARFLEVNGRYEEALEYYGRALELRPEHGRTLVYMGVCLEKLGHVHEALQRWEEVEALDHEVPVVLLQARVNRGHVALGGGNVDAALSLWRSAHSVQPDAEEPLRLIAEWAAGHNRWDEAEWAARRWADLSPKNAQPYYIAALALNNLGAREEADAFFSRAHALDPDNMTILRNYTRYLVSTGRREEAERCVVKTQSMRTR